MTRFNRIALTSIGLLLLLTVLCPSLRAEDRRQRVLFLSSYHPAFPTFPLQVHGMKSVFDDRPILLDIEFMDSKRFAERENIENFRRSLEYKLSRSEPYDILVTGDDNALNFALENRRELFEGLPVVFLGVNDVDLALMQDENSAVTGLVEAVSMKETLALMSRLHPRAKRIVALVDGTPTGQEDLKTFYRHREDFPSVTLTDISLAEYSFDEFAGQLKGLGEEDAVLLLSAYRDRKGRGLLFHQSLKLINRNLSRPLYHIYSHGIGEGAVGGKVVSHFEQGRAAAEIVSEILGGKAAEEIPVRQESPNRHVFDYGELQRFGLELSELPEGGILLNEPRSQYQQHKKVIWPAAGIFFGYSLLLFAMYRNMRKRMKTEGALKESEERFRTLFDKAADAIFLHDMEGRLLDVNQSAAKSLGYSRAELLAMRVEEVDAEFTDRRHLEKFWSRLAPGKPVVLEGRHRRKDGKTFAVEVHLVLLERGGEPAVLALARDITERKRSEEALRESEERFRSIFEHAAAGMGIVAPDGSLFQVNSAVCRFYGYTEEELLKLKVEEFTHPDDRAKTRGFYKELIAGERRVADYEKRYLRKDGAVVWGRTTLAPVYDTDGNLSYLIAMVQDIDDRKRAEKASRKALAEAEEARDKIEVILKSVADGLIFTDAENRILLMSASAEAMLDRSLQDVFLRPIDAVVGNPALQERLAEIQGGAPEGAPVELELPGEGEGQSRTIQAKPSLVKGKGGATAGVITLLSDVSSEREIDRIKSEFISTAAHELRTPLTSVMGFSELLLTRSGFDEEEQRGYLSIIHEKSKALESIVDDLLDLRRVESGEVIRVKKELCDIGSIIGGAASDYRRACDSHLFATELPEAPVELEADEGKIVQVMENLLGNAVKFSPEGSTIRVSCELLDNEVSILVGDRGVGMTPEEAEKVFDKFYRVDASTTAKAGLGLGMAIVKSIIEAHDGSIRVESEPGQGTEVFFTLPR